MINGQDFVNKRKPADNQPCTSIIFSQLSTSFGSLFLLPLHCYAPADRVVWTATALMDICIHKERINIFSILKLIAYDYIVNDFPVIFYHTTIEAYLMVPSANLATLFLFTQCSLLIKLTNFVYQFNFQELRQHIAVIEQ